MKSLYKYIIEKQIKIGDLFSFDDSKFDEYFRTEKGRNKIAELCIPYVHAIAHTMKGYDHMDLFSAGLFGLTEAMNNYNPEKNEDFLKYAGICISGRIKDYITELSRVVHVPKTQQPGSQMYIKQNNISLSKLIDDNASHNDDVEDNEIKVDLSVEDVLTNVDKHDIKYLVDIIKRKLSKQFKHDEVKIFLDFYGLNKQGEKIKNKDLAKQYNCVESNISYIVNKVKKFLYNNLYNELTQLRDIFYKK